MEHPVAQLGLAWASSVELILVEEFSCQDKVVDDVQIVGCQLNCGQLVLGHTGVQNPV